MSTAFRRIRRFIRSWDLYAIMLLIAWPFVYYLPITVGQKAFSEGDILWIYLPTRVELARALAQGQLPLWTPAVQAGFPLVADGHVAAFYPLNLLFYLFLPVQYALSYTILVNLALTSVGMYLLARVLGVRIPSAILAGFVFGAGGAFTARVSHLDVLTTISWLPWLVLFQLKYWQARLGKQKSVHWFILLCLSIALQFLGGSPPMAFLNLAACVCFGFLGPFLCRQSVNRSTKDMTGVYLKKWLPEAMLVTLGSILIGIGLAAIQLLPTAELTSLSIRAQEMGKSFFTSYSLEPSALTQFVVPFWHLGEPNAGNMEFWGYIGILPLFLAFLALFLRRDFRTLFLFLFGVLTLSLALGGSNPLYGLLYNVPVFNRFRVPARFLFLSVFSFALLAGLGFDDLQSRLRNSHEMNWKLGILGATLVALAAGTIYLAYNRPVEFWLEVWRWLPVLLIIASVGVIAVVRFHLATQTTFGLIVLGLSILDLTAFSSPFLTTLTRMTTPDELVQIPRTVLAMNPTQTPYRVFVNRFPSVTQAAVRATLWSGLPLIYGKAGVIVGYNPFTLALQKNEEYIQNMSLPMRNLMNIRYYLLPLETAPSGDPTPFDGTEPNGGLTMDLLKQQPGISPTRVASVEIVSYTDQSSDLPDSSLAGELMLTSDSGKTITMPIRLGIETADWAYDGIAQIGKVNHSKPSNSQTFPAYLASVGREFQGRKYVAHYNLDAGITASAVGVRSFLADNGLKVESVSLIDEQSHSVSLATLLHRNELALAFRSHTAAMWENKSVIPRAFMVHSAEVSSDEETLSRMQQSDFRPDETLLLDEPLPLGGSNAAPQQKPNDQVQITQYQPERVVIDVNAGAPGYLVLTDSWYPGWVATIDGKDAPIVRADYIFRALAMPAGQHTVVFEYKPMSLIWGAVISGLSIIVCIGLAIIAYLRARRRLQNENHLVTA